jgi:hypothetical protein
MGNLLTEEVGNILTTLLGNVLTTKMGKVLDIYNILILMMQTPPHRVTNR